MNILEWFFFFHPKSSLRGVLSGREEWTGLWGHVEAAGYTEDDTWLFFDPLSRQTRIRVTHRHDDVVCLLDSRLTAAEQAFRIRPLDRRVSYPLIRPHLHCVTQCSALLGVRAYTVTGFKRILAANGAQEVDCGAEHQRRPGRETGPEARTAPDPA